MNKLLILIAVLGCANLFGQSVWEKLPGPPGCVISDIEQDSSGIIYLISRGSPQFGLYKSTDDGQNWQMMPQIDTAIIDAAEIVIGKDGAIYLIPATTPINKFYKSIDGGISWSKLTKPAPECYRFAVCMDGSLLSEGTYLHTYKSTDGGQTWMANSSTDIYGSGASVRGILVGKNGKVWMNFGSGYTKFLTSDDNGTTFSEIKTIYDYIPSYGEALIGDSLLIRDNDSLKLINQTGQTLWSRGIFNAIPNKYIGDLFISNKSRLILECDTYEYLYSDDLGQSWDTLPGPKLDFFSPGSFRFFSTKNGSTLLGSPFFDIGVWKSVDNDSTWSFSSNGISSANIFDVFSNRWTGNVYCNTGNGLFLSKANGQNWSLVQRWTNNKIAFSPSGEVFIVHQQKVYRVSSDGNDFTEVTDTAGYTIYAFGVSNSGVLYCLNSKGYSKSSNGGGSWQKVGDLPNGGTNSPIYFVDDSTHIFLTLQNIYLTKNSGASWQILPAAPGTTYVLGFHLSDWGELFYFDNKYICHSKDLGQSWQKTDLPPNHNPSFFTSYEDGRIFLVDQINGLLVSDDFGETWAIYHGSDFLQSIKPYIPFHTEGGNLFIGTLGNSVWKTNDVFPTIAKISGQISKDQNQNCLLDTADLPLQNWLIQATDTAGHTGYATTDPTGHYRLGFIIPDSTSTDLTLKTLPPNQLWQPCDSTQTLTVTPQDDTKTGIDFPMDAVVDCPLLDVTASFWPARPCFPLTIGADWCNLGTLPAPDSRLFLKLDPLISVDSASMPIAAQHGDTLEFALGDVALNACGSVRIYGHLSCDAVLGQAICVSAKVTPDSICAAFPTWSGATLHATANCSGDTVVDFTIKNIGTAPSTSGLEYVVIEDQVLLFTGQVPSLVPGADITFGQPADGSTFSLKGEQEPGHPVSNFIFAWAEGCGEPPSGQPEFGWITPFLGEDGDPFSDEFCREATASYDPNLKEALPVGYGAEHFISPNQAIDYFLHFQNSGTDTAFQVVLRDTISSLLDLASLRMGASSHPFLYEIYGDGILKFIFKKINLPDSTVNEPASHGWVNFQIGQKKDLPLGTVIRNHVGIYFDFNAPVLTNETWHTLGENFILLDWKNLSEKPKTGLKIYPNPLTESVVFDLQNIENQEVVIEISMPDGRVVRQVDFSQKPFLIRRDGLLSGVYFFKISTKNGAEIGSGKLLIW